MYNKIIIAMVMLGLLACESKQTTSSKKMYHSEAFTLYQDRVVQGENVGTVLSPTHLKSNYKSPAAETFPRLITFKFSINEKDNELPSGINHWVIIDDQKESPLFVFGEKPQSKPQNLPQTFLPVNYTYTFKVDVSPVLEAFDQQGFYVAQDGSKIAKEDFKGFFIAGGAEPLTWDFVNLDSKSLKLSPTKDPDIYSITVVLNPFDPQDIAEKEWKKTVDTQQKAQYQSEQPLVDALYNMSLEEAVLAIEPDSTLRTGAKWGGVWTRDVSYSIFLAFAYHEPEVAKISLRKKIKRDRIIQDTGSGGAWPVSSDRTTWSLAAWELYKITGDKDWLAEAYVVILNSLEDDYKTLYDAQTGLYKGESSFLDWREQTYPKWMENMDIYVSQNLGTNVVHYQAHQILAQMAKALGKPYALYEERANMIKEGINQQLWMADKGYYAQFIYGRPYLNPSPRFEALGEALAIIFGVADTQKAQSIVANAPLTPFGTTCIYPQIPNIPPYHNNGIWPFVQSYWNLAAAKVGNEKALEHGLAAIYRAGGLFLTNYENFVAETGDFEGTEVNSHRMLWSMAGNLAMVHRVFIGMNFQENGITFQPVVPASYGGTKNLSNFHYRKATLNITVKGFGNQVKSFALDGKKISTPFVPNDLKGTHDIVIELDNQPFDAAPINLQPNHTSLTNPITNFSNGILEWQAIEGAINYRIYQNGQVIDTTQKTTFTPAKNRTAVYKVTAIDAKGWESFSSKPTLITENTGIIQVELEKSTTASDLPYTNYSGKGFVEISNEKNRRVSAKVTVKSAGKYRIDIRYANGSGPWNTDNKCAIRSLYTNQQYTGTLVFPQRGTNEWSDWGWSNSYDVQLKKGTNDVEIIFEPWNINMNVDINRAMLDYIRVVEIGTR